MWKRWYWIIGLDAIRELPSWHRISEVVDLCHWLVAPRPSQTSTDDITTDITRHPDANSSYINAEEINAEEINAEKQKAELEATLRLLRQPLPKLQVTLLNCEAIAVSSTQVRERLQHQESIRSLVPPAVADYIDRHHLYQ